MSKFKFAATLALGAALALSLVWAPAANAASQAELEAKIQAMEQSLQAMKQQLSEVSQTQHQQQVVARKAASDALPKWVQRMKFYGDTRFRFEHTTNDEFQGTEKDDRSRFRVRLRFGVKSQIHEDVELGFRMASGSDDDPTSTNHTMGNYWGEIQSWGIDRAYVKYMPSFVPQKAFSFTFGKAKNPFVTSKAIFDGDVVPEGAFAKVTLNKKGTIQPFVLGSWLYLKEHKNEPPDDLYAYAGQAGVKGKMNALKFTLATTYYDWNDLGKVGELPPNIHGNPIYVEDGEERLSNFKVWDVIAKASYKVSKMASLSGYGHWLTNTDASGPNEDKDTGWSAGVGFKYGPFHSKVWYKYVEANASPGFIADSDSGFVNREGIVLQAGYKFFKYADLTLKYFNMESIDEDIQAASNDYQTFFADFVFKF
jgi:hypothetical protein